MWQSIPELGSGLLLAALVAAGSSFALATLSVARPRLIHAARSASYGTVALVGTAVVVLAYAFVTHDFRLSYVVRYSDRSMSLGYLISSLWGGQDGSLLWWLFLLAAYSGACIWWLRDRYLALQPYVIATLMSVIVFFGLVTIFAADPFTTTLTQAPVDGKGLNPLLQNIYMVIHPPTLYLGFVGCTVPFAFAVAALISGRLGNEWVVAVRRWMLFAWLFLSLGNALGMIWAYVELGWGGYWGWDPVENSSFLPWLTATAYVHSTMIQERRGMFKLWNLVLIAMTFLLTIFGTFLTRSGVIASVHAFAKSDLGSYFLYYLGLLLVGSIALIVWRLPKLRSEERIDALASREAAFVSNNWAFVGATLFVGIATTLPIISEALVDRTVSVGPEFYNRWMTPIGLTIFALMGLGPLLGWRRTNVRAFRRGFIVPVAASVMIGALHLALGSRWHMPAIVVADPPADPLVIAGVPVGTALRYAGSIVPLVTTMLAGFNVAVIAQEIWRGSESRVARTGERLPLALVRCVTKARRRYGGYIVHLGITLMFLGFLGQAWSTSTEASVVPGERFRVGGYELAYERVRVERDAGKEMLFADFMVTGPNGRVRGVVSPASFYYRSHPNQPTSEVSVLRTVREDLYVVLGSLAPKSGRAAVQAHVNPLVSWIWAGVVVLVLGAALSLWPKSGGQPRADFTRLATGVASAVRAVSNRNRARAALPRRIAQSWKALPLIGLLASIVASAVQGFPTGLLVIGATLLLVGVWNLWVSLQIAAGDRDTDPPTTYRHSPEQEQKAFLLQALEDLDFERVMGKIDEDDYRDARQAFRRRAREALSGRSGQELAFWAEAERLAAQHLEHDEASSQEQSTPAEPRPAESEQG